MYLFIMSYCADLPQGNCFLLNPEILIFASICLVFTPKVINPSQKKFYAEWSPEELLIYKWPMPTTKQD